MEVHKTQRVLYLSVVYASIEMCCEFSWYWSCSSRSGGNFGSRKAFVNVEDFGLIMPVVIEVELGHNKVGFVVPPLITMEKQSQYYHFRPRLTNLF